MLIYRDQNTGLHLYNTKLKPKIRTESRTENITNNSKFKKQKAIISKT